MKNNIMEILRIAVGGFANIAKTELHLSTITALLSHNNYGKSNVLNAIQFGLEFMQAESFKRKKMMRALKCIPINLHTENEAYNFEIEVKVPNNGCEQLAVYGFSFSWMKKNVDSHIISEYLKIKKVGDTKYTSCISRTINSCNYLSSESGRCSSKLEVSAMQLAISKIENFDSLFYLDILKAILNIQIVCPQTLADPETIFRTIHMQDKSNDSLYKDDCGMPDFASCALFLYNLKKLDSNKYAQLKDAISHLIPTIQDFEPIKVDLKKQVARLNKNDEAPFMLPEYIYDIRVKERNLNQQITIDRLSAGTKRIFYILLMTVAAQINDIPVITFEELENSIHPSLFQNLLTSIRSLAGDTKIIITSHSPYLLQYLKPTVLYIGIPNDKDIALFKKLKNSKINSLTKLASDNDISLGDYLFDMLLDVVNEEDALVTKYFD